MLLKDWEEYLESLCANHASLLHTADNRRFVKYGTEEAATNQSKLGSPFVRHTHFDYNHLVPSRNRYSSTLFFLGKISKNTLAFEEAVRQVRDATQLIADEFDARIRSDYENGYTCSLLKDIEGASVVAVDMTEQDCYGWEYTISLIDENFDVDTNKWIDL